SRRRIKAFDGEIRDALYAFEDVLESHASNQLASHSLCLHSVFRHFCIREAENDGLFHVLNSFRQGGMKSQPRRRRLCIHNNILLGIKDAYESVTSMSTAHSLLCTGRYHRYPVPICFGLKLLRVMDALTIRFYEFPLEVLDCVQLRYLALTCYEDLPPTILRLWNLQHLIVLRHSSIKSCGVPSYLPMEIWDMKELKHLQVTRSSWH
ncbi:hypothetical protein PHJA_001431600, partial [Phtheirospermum japonicum]